MFLYSFLIYKDNRDYYPNGALSLLVGNCIEISRSKHSAILHIHFAVQAQTQTRTQTHSVSRRRYYNTQEWPRTHIIVMVFAALRYIPQSSFSVSVYSTLSTHVIVFYLLLSLSTIFFFFYLKIRI